MSASGKTNASEKFAELSEHARKAAQRVVAAQSEAKADVERSASNARASAQARADKAREAADAGQAHVSASWNELQTSWSDHIAKMRENLHGAKTAFDITQAVDNAEDAEGDAIAAIDFAYGAIEEAEAAALAAISASMEVDELVKQTPSRT